MRKIIRTKSFKKDFKSLIRQPDFKKNFITLEYVIKQLVYDIPLNNQFKDHALIGNWKGFRNCHIKTDLVLIYQKIDKDTLKILKLNRINSHSKLNF